MLLDAGLGRTAQRAVGGIVGDSFHQWYRILFRIRRAYGRNRSRLGIPSGKDGDNVGAVSQR